MTLHRLQRWAVILQSYEYNIRYKNTKNHANADALSRLPMGEDIEFDNYEKSMLDIENIYESTIADFPIDAHIIAEHIKNDNILRSVSKYITEGWPENIKKSQSELLPYYLRKMSLSLVNGVILIQTDHIRVVIPTSLHKQILYVIHEGHWGKSQMKQIARRYVWFPKIDEAIENISKCCSTSQEAGSNPNREFSSWPKATKPWERIHVDFAGPFFSQMWLIVVYAYSRFPYVIEMSTATSSTTIHALRDIFSVEGLPNTIVKDNGSQFTSKDFEEFCRRNAIEHITSPPFHPSSNGLAERTVRTFKESFKKNMCDKQDKSRAVFKFLSTYRSTPNTVTGKSPAELLHGCQPRTILSALFPSKHSKVENQTKFKVNDLVYARNFAGTKKWIEGTITNVEGKMMYAIKCK
ncbi:uncharacterized protein K02A2.6-like [Lucilia cuprina]|uniref:uncharacterized protein K02A2.6-like n=1 Tax=Lucilia cuprina TaxID=7375 RepID=UPI001F06E8A0|nr:uncharacterized protein K02A2.6-like [Lucilia cuprina]